MKGLFLDTATQIARHWHADSERERIAEDTKGRNLYCSLYVQCQYKATLLNAIIGLHNLLLRFKDLMKALQESKSYQNKDVAVVILTKGMQERINMVGLAIARHYEEYDEQIDRFRFLIEDAWEAMFASHLTMPLVDETLCVYAKNTPEQGVSGAYEPVNVSCTIKDPHSCGIVEFWNNHRVQLQILADMEIDSITAEPKDKKELERVKAHAGIIAKGKTSHGQRCTVHLSDAIICLEGTHCPEEVAVHSTNKKHFGPIAELIGIDCEPKD